MSSVHHNLGRYLSEEGRPEKDRGLRKNENPWRECVTPRRGSTLLSRHISTEGSNLSEFI